MFWSITVIVYYGEENKASVFHQFCERTNLVEWDFHSLLCTALLYELGDLFRVEDGQLLCNKHFCCPPGVVESSEGTLALLRLALEGIGDRWTVKLQRGDPSGRGVWWWLYSSSSSLPAVLLFWVGATAALQENGRICSGRWVTVVGGWEPCWSPLTQLTWFPKRPPLRCRRRQQRKSKKLKMHAPHFQWGIF